MEHFKEHLRKKKWRYSWRDRKRGQEFREEREREGKLLKLLLLSHYPINVLSHFAEVKISRTNCTYRCRIHVHSVKWLRYGLLQQTEIYRLIFPKVSIWSLGPTKPPIPWIMDEMSSGVKRLGREADESPPSFTRLWKNGVITVYFPYTFMTYTGKTLPLPTGYSEGITC